MVFRLKLMLQVPGTVADGDCAVQPVSDESMMTGESVAIERVTGDAIAAL